MYLFIQICLYVNSYLQSALGQERINFSLNHNDTLLLKVKFSFKYRRETCWELEQAGVSEMLHDEKKKKSLNLFWTYLLVERTPLASRMSLTRLEIKYKTTLKCMHYHQTLLVP